MGGGGAGGVLCCWPHSDTSSGRYSRRSTINNESAGRLSELVVQDNNTSAISLHIPTTSGVYTKQPLSAHRSHEEIRRRPSQHLPARSDRHASAPSVIDEVIHRRDWDRSSKELYIPLHPDSELETSFHNKVHIDNDSDDESFRAPLALTESLSIEDNIREEKVCKKHHTNIKSSKKESNDDDAKDIDATELNFYIGDQQRDDTLVELSTKADSLTTLVPEVKVCKLKTEKQCLNESIKSMERSVENSVCEYDYRPLGDESVDGLADESLDGFDALDRSGATHSMEHSAEVGHLPYTPSVEAVEYGSVLSSPGGAGWGGAGVRPRHASDTDVIARAQRPRSAPFSESDLELDASCDEVPPPYDDFLEPRRETAV